MRRFSVHKNICMETAAEHLQHLNGGGAADWRPGEAALKNPQVHV